MNWPAIVAGIAAVEVGRGDSLMALRDTFAQRGPDGSYGNVLEACLAINCIDEDRHTPERETALREAVADVAPIFDTGAVTPSVSPCAGWPGAHARFPHADDVDEQLAETLVVSVTGDPATPHEGGVPLAQRLHGSLLTVEGEQHGAVFVGGSPRVDGLVADYLLTLRTPPVGTTCSL